MLAKVNETWNSRLLYLQLNQFLFFGVFVGISKSTEYGRGVFVQNLSLEELLSINISDSV